MTGIDLLVWAVFGLVAGIVAQFLMPGKDIGESLDLKGFVITTLLGIVGAMVGGYIGNALGITTVATTEANALLNWRTFATAVCGALVVLCAYRAIKMLFGFGTPATPSYGAPATNLTEAVSNSISPDVVNKLSSAVGESPSNTRKALGAIIPTIMAGVAHQASTSSGASRVFEMAKESFTGSGNVINNLANHVSGSRLEGVERTGQNFLGSIFGDKIGDLQNWIGQFAGIKGSSVSQLMGLASNLVMNVLGKQIATKGLSAAGLGDLLSGQRSWLSRLLPSGVSEVPGISTLTDYASHAGTAARDAATAGGRAVAGAAHDTYRAGVGTAQAATPWLSALVPLLLVGLLAAGAFYMVREYGKRAVPVVKAPDVKLPEVKIPEVKAPVEHVVGYRPEMPKLSSIKLPDGVNLEIPETGFVNRVYKYLTDTADIKPHAVTFEGLNFDGSAIKSALETETAVKTLSTVLKNFPNATIRITGHTDKTNDPTADTRVTQERANAVKDLIVKAGIPADRISTTGAGSEKPIAPNDTDENRAKNRRIELTIEKK